LLHASSKMGRLPDSSVVHAEVTADGTNDHFARIETDPHQYDGAVRSADFLGIFLDRALDPYRGVALRHRRVLAGNGSAEKRHDPVAHDLIDRPLISVNGLHHPLEHRVENLARLLRVTVSEKLHRALEIGEEHSDLLALAFEGTLGSEDLLGEVPWGV